MVFITNPVHLYMNKARTECSQSRQRGGILQAFGLPDKPIAGFLVKIIRKKRISLKTPENRHALLS
jgi:hypothetical protein